MGDAALEPLAVAPLTGRAGLTVDLARIAGVGVGQYELAEVGEEGRADQLAPPLGRGLRPEPVGRRLGRDRVEAEALRHEVPAGGALEEVEGGGALGEGLDAVRRQDLDRFGN